MRVLIIGGYGNFGSYIAKSLADDADIQLLIGGRSREKAARFINGLKVTNPAEPHAIDIDSDLNAVLTRIAPHLVIHTTGPFQAQDHRVAKACIDQGCHYFDLADARDFVATIGTLDAAAKAKGVSSLRWMKNGCFRLHQLVEVVPNKNSRLLQSYHLMPMPITIAIPSSSITWSSKRRNRNSVRNVVN